MGLGRSLLLRKIILTFIASFGVAVFLTAHALAQEKRLSSPRRRRRRIPACSTTCCLFTQKTGITVKILAQGTGQRSIPAGAVKPTSCSCMQNRRNKSFSPKEKA